MWDMLFFHETPLQAKALKYVQGSSDSIKVATKSKKLNQSPSNNYVFLNWPKLYGFISIFLAYPNLRWYLLEVLGNIKNWAYLITAEIYII